METYRSVDKELHDNNEMDLLRRTTAVETSSVIIAI